MSEWMWTWFPVFMALCSCAFFLSRIGTELSEIKWELRRQRDAKEVK